MTLQELCKELSIAESSIRTNFPKMAKSLAKKGIIITRDKQKYPNTNYFIEYGQPQELNKNELNYYYNSQQEKTNQFFALHIDSEEEWIQSCLSDDILISSLGRYKINNSQPRYGTKNANGYLQLTYQDKKYLIHRIVLQSFNPNKNAEFLSVDHINGVRTDNSLKNLRWMPIEENIGEMFSHRKELNKELTRIIQIYGYDETLKKLQRIL